MQKNLQEIRINPIRSVMKPSLPNFFYNFKLRFFSPRSGF